MWDGNKIGELAVGVKGERPCTLDGLTEFVGGVSGTGDAGEENKVGEMLQEGVSSASGDELDELLPGVEVELLGCGRLGGGATGRSLRHI